jgi:hypothetical protein
MPGAPERRARLARNGKVGADNPLSDAYIGRYRNAVPRHEVVFMQLHAHRLMRKYGYAPDHVDLSLREWAQFVAVWWPSQAARMLTWRGLEVLQQRLPSVAARRPDPRTVVAATGVAR